MRVNLVVVEGKPLGAVIPLKADRFVIGRDPGCQLRPKSEAVGGRQCAIKQEGGQVSVCDLGGIQGTFVNDRCLHRGDEVRVRDGDRLQVGQLIFTIQIDADPIDPGAAGGVEEWLASPPPGNGPRVRRNASSSISSPAALSVDLPRPRQPPEAVGIFAYTTYDQARRAACIGLGQAQVTEEAGVRALRQALLDMMKVPMNRRMVLDLAAVDDLPSLAVAMLMRLARRCEEAGGELRICSAPAGLERRLVALKFESVLAWYSDLGTALDDPWD